MQVLFLIFAVCFNFAASSTPSCDSYATYSHIDYCNDCDNDDCCDTSDDCEINCCLYTAVFPGDNVVAYTQVREVDRENFSYDKYSGTDCSGIVCDFESQLVTVAAKLREWIFTEDEDGNEVFADPLAASSLPIEVDGEDDDISSIRTVFKRLANLASGYNGNLSNARKRNLVWLQTVYKCSQNSSMCTGANSNNWNSPNYAALTSRRKL